MELLGKSKEELRAFCTELGEPAFRGAQIYHALYSERKFDVTQITNLPAALRERLSKEARVTLPEVKQRFASADGSVRYLFELQDAEKVKTFNAEDTARRSRNQKQMTHKSEGIATDDNIFARRTTNLRISSTEGAEFTETEKREENELHGGEGESKSGSGSGGGGGEDSGGSGGPAQRYGDAANSGDAARHGGGGSRRRR